MGIELPTDLERRLFDAIDEPTWLALASALVRAGQPEAENPLDPDQPAGREEGIANLVAEKLEAIGLAVEKHALEP